MKFLLSSTILLALLAVQVAADDNDARNPWYNKPKDSDRALDKKEDYPGDGDGHHSGPDEGKTQVLWGQCSFCSSAILAVLLIVFSLKAGAIITRERRNAPRVRIAGISRTVSIS
jgi:hypothetical protein